MSELSGQLQAMRQQKSVGLTGAYSKFSGPPKEDEIRSFKTRQGGGELEQHMFGQDSYFTEEWKGTR